MGVRTGVDQNLVERRRRKDRFHFLDRRRSGRRTIEVHHLRRPVGSEIDDDLIGAQRTERLAVASNESEAVLDRLEVGAVAAVMGDAGNA